MTEEDKKPRPNANYNLSKLDGASSGNNENPTFYYNRERRLEKAPQAVKDLYVEKKPQNRFNLLRPLVADKPRALVFSTIIMMSAVIIVISLVNKYGGSYSLEGNRIEITGTRFEGTTIVVLTKTIKKNADYVYTGAVDIAVSYPVSGAESGEEYPVFYHRIFFSMETTEEYRFAVPFDSPEQLMVLQTEKNTLQIKYKPE
jgi:ABC-type molybdate transport system substrate-binding protein